MVFPWKKDNPALNSKYVKCIGNRGCDEKIQTEMACGHVE